ncbi:MAG TPA: DUF3305 domain-containing protein [Burkholderiaceae bacterium]|nr:DUF3305 domain-containing protein [Burkholderiaceae bacterium]
MTRPSVNVAVVMERIAQPNRWEDWQHRVVEVIADDGAFGTGPRMLHDDGKRSQWLHPGFQVELFADECKGYFLNLTSGHPVWFVPWRLDEGDASRAQPVTVSLSYIVADRWLSADEKVDTVPLPNELCEWLRVFTNANFTVDEPRRQRAQSFLSPEEREARARRMVGGGGG